MTENTNTGFKTSDKYKEKILKNKTKRETKVSENSAKFLEMISGEAPLLKRPFLIKLNGKKHHLISSVCISKNGSMVWNYTDKASLTMKKMSNKELKEYLSKIKDEDLYAYNVYQIEGEGRDLFSRIEGDENTIMGLPVKKIKEYINSIG